VSSHSSSAPDPGATPFFAALVEWAGGDSTVWGCPGHARGELFAKSPAGRAFREFFGDNVLLADASNAVEALGQLLDHTGPIGAGERRAARTFRADHLFFVLGGTSAANKMVWNATVGAGDVALVDRNCHKSVLHAIMATGAIPVYLQPTRNLAGLIGPIPRGEFSRDSIRRKLAAHPLVADPDRPVRLIALTQSTYDGIVYHADEVKRLLDGAVDVFHFDEAWLAHAGFHEFYDGWHAIDNTRPRTQRAIVYATQSTHKLLGAMTQASQVLVQDSESVALDRALFNESFMMHTTTSPQYSLLASCEVSAAIMAGDAGRELVAGALADSLDFRRAMNRAGAGRDWWFGTWGPDLPEGAGVPERADWELTAGAAWHGFAAVDDRFAMLDPTKVTVTSPGMSLDGEYATRGIPAVIIQKYLAEHRVIVEKTSLYATLFIFTVGMPRGAWRPLIATLEQFKADYDAGQPGLPRPRPARGVRRAALHLPRRRHRPPDRQRLHRAGPARHAARRGPAPARGRERRARAGRGARRAHHRGAARAVPARDPATGSRRAGQRGRDPVPGARGDGGPAVAGVHPHHPRSRRGIAAG
jgi:arginine decarboxylase